LVYGEVASSVAIIAGVISTEKTTVAQTETPKFPPVVKAPVVKAPVVKTTAMESSAMKASTMKTTAPETSAVGLGSSNADDGRHHPQFAGHG
jgi:hypothetical protein